ncbi:alpha-crystallin domain-containing protein 22.3-like, partial [Capsicum annuum]|uniref:alpha-crystallin domain-containing protein 22.3-like n=1 Tax=Capsicum annuum TaxID=4072 RepID=UPI001FB09B11
MKGFGWELPKFADLIPQLYPFRRRKGPFFESLFQLPPVGYRIRASQSSVPNSGEASSSIPMHPQPLNVAPISWYSSTPDINAGSVSVEAITLPSKRSNSQRHAGGQPVVVLFSACPAKEEWDNLINHANGGVALTGSALYGKVGPFMCSVDIAKSEDAYVFRVSLPGVARDE